MTDPSPDTPGSLARSIGKRQPFDVPEEELFLNLARTYLDLAAPLQRLLKSHDLSFSLFNALTIAVGHSPQGVPIGTLTQQLIFPAPDTTRLVAKLEQMGLVQREKDSGDGRVVRVTATAKGKTLSGRIRPLVQQAHRHLLGELPHDDLRQLITLLEHTRTIAENAKRDE